MSFKQTLKSLFTFRIVPTKNTEPVKSKDGFLMLDSNGVASVDYSNPEARRKLREQIEAFSKIKVSNS